MPLVWHDVGHAGIPPCEGRFRPVDQFRRVVFPVELRRTLGISVGAGLEIFSKLHEPGCVFRGVADEVVEFKGHKVCHQCVAR